MEPLSITASIIAVVTAACQVSNGLIKLTAALQDAPDIVMALNNEVNDIQLVVHSARDVLDQKFGGHNSKHFNARSEVVYVKGSLHKAEMVLNGIHDYFQSKLVDSNGKFSKLRFLKERSKLVEAKDELRGIRLEIVNGLQLVNLASSFHVVGQIDVLESVVRQGYQTQAYNLTNGFSELNQKMDKLSVALHARFPVQQTPSTSMPVVHAQRPAPGYQRQNGAVTLNFQYAGHCNPRCGCTCHLKKIVQTPALLSRFIGRIFIGYSGIPSLSPSCDIPTCKRTTTGALKLQYIFPEWLITSMLTMEARVSQSPEILIKTWNIRPRDAAVFEAAIDNDLSDLQDLLLEGKASLRDVNSFYGFTILHMSLLLLAVGTSSFDDDLCDMIEFLLSQGADMHVENTKYITPYTLFIMGILRLGINTSLPERVASLFPHRDVELENFQLSRIHKLVLNLESGNLEEELQSYNGTGLIDKPDKCGRTPLHWALIKDNSDLAQLLLDYGADPLVKDVFSFNALYYAQSVHIFKRCIQNCQPASRLQDCTIGESWSLLENCLFHDHHKTTSVSELDRIAKANAILEAVGNTFDIDFPDTNGSTPLMMALNPPHISRPNITKFLLDAGSDCNRTNKKGQTAAMVGLSRKSYSDLDVLFGEPRDFDFTIKDNSGWNILHYLMEYADMRTLKLVSAIGITGIDVDDRNNKGQTARDILTARLDRGGQIEFFYSWENDNLRVVSYIREAFHSFLDRIEGASRISFVEDISDGDGETDAKSLSESIDTDEDDEFHDALENSP